MKDAIHKKNDEVAMDQLVKMLSIIEKTQNVKWCEKLYETFPDWLADLENDYWSDTFSDETDRARKIIQFWVKFHPKRKVEFVIHFLFNASIAFDQRYLPFA